MQSLFTRSRRKIRPKKVRAWLIKWSKILRLHGFESVILGSWRKLQPNRAKAWLILGGVFSSVMFLSLGASIASNGSVAPAFPGQELVQVLVALFMFGYYLGTASSRKPNYSYFLTGFLGISLVYGFWLVSLRGVGIPEVIGLASTGITGLFFGSTKQVVSQRIDDIVKWLVNVGGWSFHGTGLVAALSPGPDFPVEVITLLILIITIVWGLVILRRS